MPTCVSLDLAVLASLPRQLLVSPSARSLVNLVRPDMEYQHSLWCLTKIFSVPPHSGYRESSPRRANFLARAEEQSAARALYFLYLDAYPNFWDIVVKAADTVVLLEPALADNEFIASIISASWQVLPNTPSETRFPLPTESWLREECNHGDPLARTGISAILSRGTAQIVLPYLMKPAHTFSRAVGGGKGDVESAAWKVAVAKHDALRALRETLVRTKWSPEVGIEILEAMVSAVSKRISQAQWGQRVRSVVKLGLRSCDVFVHDVTHFQESVCCPG